MEAQARALGEGEESARLTLPAMTLGGKHDSENRTAGTDGRARALLLAPGPAGLWRAGGARRPDGARAGGREGLADQRADARGDRDLPVLAGAARNPGRHLGSLPPCRFLGSLGRR